MSLTNYITQAVSNIEAAPNSLDRFPGKLWKAKNKVLGFIPSLVNLCPERKIEQLHLLTRYYARYKLV